mmetsp:Transcript_670/g.2617  ORF Transcript_670/g.2617 Transcript_670/m.2617 type:complete len:255 (+) Transcript_670:302-1066(+)
MVPSFVSSLSSSSLSGTCSLSSSTTTRAGRGDVAFASVTVAPARRKMFSSAFTDSVAPHPRTAIRKPSNTPLPLDSRRNRALRGPSIEPRETASALDASSSSKFSSSPNAPRSAHASSQSLCTIYTPRTIASMYFAVRFFTTRSLEPVSIIKCVTSGVKSLSPRNVDVGSIDLIVASTWANFASWLLMPRFVLALYAITIRLFGVFAVVSASTVRRPCVPVCVSSGDVGCVAQNADVNTSGSSDEKWRTNQAFL